MQYWYQQVMMHHVLLKQHIRLYLVHNTSHFNYWLNPWQELRKSMRITNSRMLFLAGSYIRQKVTRSTIYLLHLQTQNKIRHHFQALVVVAYVGKQIAWKTYERERERDLRQEESMCILSRENTKFRDHRFHDIPDDPTRKGIAQQLHHHEREPFLILPTQLGSKIL